MMIKVKTLANRVYNVEVEPNDQIKLIKDIVHEWEGGPPMFSRFLFARQIMDTSRTFADYNVQEGSVILFLMLFVFSPQPARAG